MRVSEKLEDGATGREAHRVPLLPKLVNPRSFDRGDCHPDDGVW
jgi:hypothetical protein